MKTKIFNFLIPLLGGSATSAFAADGVLQNGGGPLVWFFIGFAALIVMAQAIPAGILLYSIIKAAFSHKGTTTLASATHTKK